LDNPTATSKSRVDLNDAWQCWWLHVIPDVLISNQSMSEPNNQRGILRGRGLREDQNANDRIRDISFGPQILPALPRDYDGNIPGLKNSFELCRALG
jgi:hypothetical protein